MSYLKLFIHQLYQISFWQTEKLFTKTVMYIRIQVFVQYFKYVKITVIFTKDHQLKESCVVC